MSSPPQALNDDDNIDFNPTIDFSDQPSYSQLLSQLRRSTLTPHNRLASIRADADFITRVASAFGDRKGGSRRPLVANERCGSWYIPPEKKEGSAYFKSTDGHERAWKFSTRRLNLHLIEMVEKNDGIIIVDSTRRGKRMPDALSTTIPIWCTVINLALLPSHPLSSKLFLPPYLPPSTHSQITALIPSFLTSLKALNLSLPTCLTKPLRPLWITQESSLPDGTDDGEEDDDAIFEDYRPIICCTASRRVIGSEVDEGGYIQGAGDDTENWALGLTPDVFWGNTDTLLSASEAELPDLIIALVERAKTERQASDSTTTRKQLTPHISVCSLPIIVPTSPPPQPSECFILLTDSSTPKETWIKSPTHIEVGLGKNKTASRNLRLALPDICAFAAKFLQTCQSSSSSPEDKAQSTGQIVVACESGKDISIGTALALSCYLFDDNGQFRVPDGDTSFTKTLVKVRLGGIMTTYPEANPSRSTLQSVNSFLMDWRR